MLTLPENLAQVRIRDANSVIGTLQYCPGGYFNAASYRFTYHPALKERGPFPLPGLTEPVNEAKDLWPFFTSLIPAESSQDFQELAEVYHLSKAMTRNPLVWLCTTGKIQASPYIIEPVILSKSGRATPYIAHIRLPEDETYFADMLRQSGGTYLKHHLMAALEHVTDWSVAVDGGAHVGIWSRLLAEQFQTVYAFEPQPMNFECLEANTQALSNVIRLPQGVGACTQCATLSAGSDNSGQWHVGEGKNEETESIDIIPIDSLELESCGFIKLDLEGYELFGLQGAQETLKRFKPVVILEENGLAERYGIATNAASVFLKTMGAQEVRMLGHDKIFTW